MSPEPAALDVGRLTLELPGLEGAEARRLALLVAEGLDDAAPGLAGASLPPAARVTLQAGLAESLDVLAARIVAGVIDALG